jgi:hypothetical protein
MTPFGRYNEHGGARRAFGEEEASGKFPAVDGSDRALLHA